MNERLRALILDLASRPTGVTAECVGVVKPQTAGTHLLNLTREGKLCCIRGGKGYYARYFVSEAAMNKFERDRHAAEMAEASKNLSVNRRTRAPWLSDPNHHLIEPVITSRTKVTIAPAPVRSLRTGWGPKDSWR